MTADKASPIVPKKERNERTVAEASSPVWCHFQSLAAPSPSRSAAGFRKTVSNVIDHYFVRRVLFFLLMDDNI